MTELQSPPKSKIRVIRLFSLGCGLILLAVLLFTIGLSQARSEFLHEKALIEAIESTDGNVETSIFGPWWMPDFVSDEYLPYCERAHQVVLSSTDDSNIDFDDLRALKKVEKLSIELTQVSDDFVEKMNQMPNVQSLTLRRFDVQKSDPQQVNKLAHIKSLHLRVSLREMSETEWGKLHQMKKLRGMFFTNTGEIDNSELKHLEEMTQLQELDLGNTSLNDDGIVFIKKLTNLKKLSIGWTAVSNDGLKNLSGLKKLKILWLRSILIGDEGVKNLTALTNLETLNLDYTNLTDAGIPHLTALKNLKCLDLSETYVTEVGVSQLRNTLPECEIIWEPSQKTPGYIEPSVEQ